MLCAPTSTCLTCSPQQERLLLEEIVEGLRRPPRALPASLALDSRGLGLLSALRRAPHFWLEPIERRLLAACTPAIAAWVGGQGEGRLLVELGAGELDRLPPLLAALPHLAGYVPVEACPAGLAAGVRRARLQRPALPLSPLVQDWRAALTLPVVAPAPPLLVMTGGVFNRMEEEEAHRMLSRLARLAGLGGKLLLATDAQEDPDALAALWAGVEPLVFNSLHHLNWRFGGTIPVAAFGFQPLLHARRLEIEFQLVARATEILTFSTHQIGVPEGAGIRAWMHRSWPREGLEFLVEDTGWQLTHAWGDAEGRCTLYALDAA